MAWVGFISEVSMMIRKYNTKRFISPETNSSAYVMCYRDDVDMFVRIANCSEIAQFYLNPKSIKSALKLIKGISAIIAGDKKSYTYNASIVKYQFKKNIFEGDNQFLIIRKISPRNKTSNSPQSQRIEVIIHTDNTCDEAEWHRKLSVLRSELEKFREFLEAEL